MIWPHVTTEHPCPICGKPDWCQFGDRAVKCMRIASDHPCESGGWYHFHESSRAFQRPPLKAHAPKRMAHDAAGLVRMWREQTRMAQINAFALQLGVLSESLLSLEACWSAANKAWAFPMRNGEGEVIGIRLRGLDGRKWAVPGSRNGIFIPKNVQAQRRLYICEGPTDTAALLSLGLYGIGRPSCNSGDDLIAQAVQKLNIKEVVIVADLDRNNPLDPGVQGAIKLKKALKKKSVIWAPNEKDIREALKNGITKQIIESRINNLKWIEYEKDTRVA